MRPRGDITADEVYADREMLNRLGYGIFDVNFGSSGVGFENIRNFSYVVAQDEDPRLYRRKVFDLVGRYYPGKLAKAIWDKFVDHKWVMSEQAGHEVDLHTAAQDWMDKYSHQFLKEWTFRQPQVPERIRNFREPHKGLVGAVAGMLVPNLRELFNAGFTITDVVKAAISEAARPGPWKALPRIRKLRAVHPGLKKPAAEPAPPDPDTHEEAPDSADADWKDEGHYFCVQKLSPEEIEEGRYYARLVANLTGHEPQSAEEAIRRWREILEHKWYMSERAGHDVGLRPAALDYFRRLNLLQETETGQES